MDQFSSCPYYQWIGMNIAVPIFLSKSWTEAPVHWEVARQTTSFHGVCLALFYRSGASVQLQPPKECCILMHRYSVSSPKYMIIILPLYTLPGVDVWGEVQHSPSRILYMLFSLRLRHLHMFCSSIRTTCNITQYNLNNLVIYINLQKELLRNYGARGENQRRIHVRLSIVIIKKVYKIRYQFSHVHIF